MGLGSRPRRLSSGVPKIVVYTWAPSLSCLCSQWGLQGFPKMGTPGAFTALQVLLNGTNWLSSDSNRSWDTYSACRYTYRRQLYLSVWKWRWIGVWICSLIVDIWCCIKYSREPHLLSSLCSRRLWVSCFCFGPTEVCRREEDIWNNTRQFCLENRTEPRVSPPGWETDIFRTAVPSLLLTYFLETGGLCGMCGERGAEGRSGNTGV